jgi:hypothetical protein
MNAIEIAVVMLLIGFLGGVMAGIVVIVSVASRREDRHYSLSSDAPDAACRIGRRFTGMSVHGSGFQLAGYQSGLEDDLREAEDSKTG